MFRQLSKALHGYARGWIVLIFFALFVAFNAVVLPASSARLAAASGGGSPIDLRFFYTPAEAYALIESYGASGRAMYRTIALTIDILFPVISTLFFSLAITWLFRRGIAGDSIIQRLNIVPFGGLSFDLLENATVVILLSIFPAESPILAWLASTFTSVKWLFNATSALLILVGIIAAIVAAARK